MADNPLAAAAMAGATGNTLRLIGAVAASFFLPLGYLAMSLLGMRRMPGLATICAALSLVGWIPWAALIVLDDLAITIDQTGNTPQLTALWTRLNDDPYMTAFLLIYVIGHLLSAVLIGYMLGRLRIIPVWAAWAFALSSLATILIFPIHNDVFQQTLEVPGLRPALRRADSRHLGHVQRTGSASSESGIILRYDSISLGRSYL